MMRGTRAGGKLELVPKPTTGTVPFVTMPVASGIEKRPNCMCGTLDVLHARIVVILLGVRRVLGRPGEPRRLPP
jgi:hypothetical protein